MPNRRLHNRFAELFGIDLELADLVNARMDEPSKWLGPNHRIVRHDLTYAIQMAAEISRELKKKEGGGKTATPLEVMRAYTAHLALDQASLNPQIRRAFKVMEAIFFE